MRSTLLNGLGHHPKFSELDFRQVIAQVEGFMRQNQGGAPIGDPVAILALDLILDRVNDMSVRLAALEKMLVLPKSAAEVLTNER